MYIAIFTLLCFSYFVLIKLKISGNPALSWGHVFPTGIAHLVSTCHILAILTICQAFLFYRYIMVICDQLSSILLLIVYGHHKACSYKVVNLIKKCGVCSDCSTHWLSPVSLPLLRPP